MATKIIDLPKFFSFSEKAPMAAGAAAATAIPAPNAEKMCIRDRYSSTHLLAFAPCE